MKVLFFFTSIKIIIVRIINKIIIHCSATRSDMDFSEQQLESAHQLRGFRECGYHFYVRKSGIISDMRDVAVPGAHCKGHNEDSIGICYEGGLAPDRTPADTRTFKQKYAMVSLVRYLLQDYPGAQVYGHRELSRDLDGNGTITPNEWMKECPCFEVAELRAPQQKLLPPGGR